ncbi:MAG: SRPBCC family protein [Nitrospirae bacterium]|nr:SRPBCC family protein [Nitrospirota bacterium]
MPRSRYNAAMALLLRTIGAAILFSLGVPLSALEDVSGQWPTAWAGPERPQVLEVRTEPSGGVRAIATLRIPAPPAVVQELLTDYGKWPELFAVSMRLARLERRDHGAVTELYIKHALLPGERRLLCENTELPGGGLRTTLLGGDFKRYARTWNVAQDGDEKRTRAEFELLVEVDTWAPDWLVALAIRRELEAHFRILREKAISRFRSH